MRFAKKSESQWFKLVSICVKSFEYGTVTTIPICSGVLIAKEYVLTSAHCTFEFIDPDSVRVELGSTYLPYAHSYRIETWTTYKLWAKENSVEVRSIDHDIAIIKVCVVVSYSNNSYLRDSIIMYTRLACNFQLLEKVNPSIKPAVITKNPNEFFYNKTVETVFWGVKNRVPGFTKIGALDVISNDECTKILTNSPLLSKNVTLDPTVFCTKLNHGVVFENVGITCLNNFLNDERNFNCIINFLG